MKQKKFATANPRQEDESVLRLTSFGGQAKKNSSRAAERSPKNGISKSGSRKKLSDNIPRQRQNGFPFKSLLEDADVKYILQKLNSPLNIFDHRSNRLIYVNEKFTRLTGLSAEECYGQELKDFGSWINAADLAMLQNEIGKRLGEVYRQYISDNSEQLNYAVNFRLKEKEGNGEPASVLAQCTVVEWDEEHSPAITLNLLTDITHYKHNQKIILTVNLLDKLTQQWKTVLKEEFLRMPCMLGEREKEIMAEILRDKSATVISKETGINIYTVRSHWRNVLQKTNCPTQKELKHKAHMEGWV